MSCSGLWLIAIVCLPGTKMHLNLQWLHFYAGSRTEQTEDSPRRDDSALLMSKVLVSVSYQSAQKQFYEGKLLMMTNSGSHLWQQCLNGRYKWFLWTDRKENPKKKLGVLCGMKGLRLLHVVFCVCQPPSAVEYFCSWSGIGIKPDYQLL